MLGINPMTAYSLLHGYVNLEPGAWVAQTGASTATATYVIALAKHAGLRTLNIVRRESAVQPLLDAGADVVLVNDEDLAKKAGDAIGNAPIELILDVLGGEPVSQLASLAKVGGTIVSYAALDRKPISLSPGDLIYRGLAIHGYWLPLWLRSTPRTRIADTYRQLADLVKDGTLAAPVDSTYPLQDHRTALAHAAQYGDGRHGKVLFTFE
jgi:NADPH:quinone reductase-like Zn-dependent oxidoreductase